MLRFSSPGFLQLCDVVAVGSFMLDLLFSMIVFACGAVDRVWIEKATGIAPKAIVPPSPA